MKKQIDQDEICFLWLKIVIQIFGKQYQDKFTPLYLKGKVLFIKCPNSAWANELQMRQEEFLIKINKNSKKGRVERINFIA